MRIDPGLAGPLRRGARMLTRALLRRARSGDADPQQRRRGGRRSRDSAGAAKPGERAGRAPDAGGPTSTYAGDYVGTPRIEYAPVADDGADPGEVVWAWVPYEEDHSQGKDRPVLVIGRERGLLLALALTSRDRSDGGDTSGRSGYVDVGSGDWDRAGRPSEANLGRILQLDPRAVRRTGSALPRARFDAVAEALRRHT